jgi:type II secretory pathway predicted ATPase ExeA
MYENFFGLFERPFAVPPLAKRYFPATAIELARQTLVRCAQRAEGIGLVTGPAGTGKTLLCQVLAEQSRGQLEVALLASGRFNTRRSLLQAILFELGLPYREMEEGDLRLSLIDHLSPRTGGTNQSGLLLIVDEAHALPLRLMEELRLITNLVRNGQARVRLILSGSPQLEERLASPKMTSFNQRVTARCYLEALDRTQTIGYIQNQIQQAQGKSESIFTADALEAIYHATDGIPRLVNQLCDHALLLAFAGGKRPLSAAGIDEAWADLQQLPTPWNISQGAPAAEKSAGVVEFGNLDDAADDLPAALPFRTPKTATNADELSPLERLNKITAQLAAIDANEEQESEDDFQPAGSIGPELELVFQSASSPFHQSFEEEEVIIDRYTAIEADALTNRPLVHSAEGRALGALLPSASQISAVSKPMMSIAPATWPGGEPSQVTRKSTADIAGIAPAAATVFETAVASSVDSQFDWMTEPAVVAASTAEVASSADFASSPAENISTEPPSMPMDSPLAAESEQDLIVVEDPPEVTIPVTIKAPVRVRRKEYRQLFAQLRRG